jgi:uncharacterized membrane protein YjjP (DUF1212 family)
MVIFGLRRLLMQHEMNIYASTLLGLIAGTSLAVALSSFEIVTTKSVALIAPTLFLIPGITMVLGGIDILPNHNSIGLATRSRAGPATDATQLKLE